MEIMELHPGTIYGLPLGSRLVIPEGAAGVVAKDDGPLPAALFLVQTGTPWVVSWHCWLWITVGIG